jgi:hypothetical protein
MSDSIIVQYVGFQAKALVREYVFTVREAASEPIQYTLTIAHEAFVSHRVRYQDAPSVCLLRLHHELAASANHPLTTQFCVTDAELADYHDAHRPKPPRGYAAHRKD